MQDPERSSPSPTKKIAIVISSTASKPYPNLRDLVAGDVVVLTRGRCEPEQAILWQALRDDIRAFVYRSEGGRDNWQRDVDLVRDADEVIVVLSREALDRTDTGAWHVIERAIADEKPLRVFLQYKDRLHPLIES